MRRWWMPVKAVHFNELLTRLDEARGVLGLNAIAAARIALPLADWIWTADVRTLREGVK